VAKETARQYAASHSLTLDEAIARLINLELERSLDEGNSFPSRNAENPPLKACLSAEPVLRLLESNLAHATHRLWAEELDVPGMLRRFAGQLRGHRQVTGTYLIALAIRHDGILVTLDRGAAALASAAGQTGSVELIS
jgi:hypothetical protein